MPKKIRLKALLKEATLFLEKAGVADFQISAEEIIAVIKVVLTIEFGS